MALLRQLISELSKQTLQNYMTKATKDILKKSRTLPFNLKRFNKRLTTVRNIGYQLEEEAPLFGRNLKVIAHDWIDSHRDILATISHLIDEGNEIAVEKYLEKYIADHNLFIAVMEVLFRGYTFQKLS